MEGEGRVRGGKGRNRERTSREWEEGRDTRFGSRNEGNPCGTVDMKKNPWHVKE